jgi:alpha-amylase
MRTAILALALFVWGCAQTAKRSDHQIITMDTLDFSAAPWVHNTNVYEVNLRQYTNEGTFKAFSKELPRLRAMGVETLWFMPITPIAQKNKKGSMGSPYACSDYTSINPEFGTLDDFKELVAQAHGLGFKVIIDWVANHTGWDHVWTKSHPEYFQKDSTGNFKIASGMDDIIELDFTNRKLREAMIEAMKFWVVECGIDGYRCDLAFWVELDFWKQARTALEKTKKLFWLGEFDALEKPEYLQVFDASYTWTWMHSTKDLYQGKLMFQVIDSLLHKYREATGKNKMNLWFTTNHDENSWNGTEYEKYGDLAMPLAVFSLTWEGIPLIYSGQELPNKKRLQFFEKDPIEWTGSNILDSFYRKLLRLKLNNPALRAGDAETTTSRLGTEGKPVLTYLRKHGSREVLVLLNFSNARQSIILTPNVQGMFRDVMDEGMLDADKTRDLLLEPWAYKVFEK